MSEPSALAGGEGYGACDDDWRLDRRIRGKGLEKLLANFLRRKFLCQ